MSNIQYIQGMKSCTYLSIRQLDKFLILVVRIFVRWVTGIEVTGATLFAEGSLRAALRPS
jgi:hypothetical protein